jgi:hypothetical protein
VPTVVSQASLRTQRVVVLMEPSEHRAGVTVWDTTGEVAKTPPGPAQVTLQSCTPADAGVIEPEPLVLPDGTCPDQFVQEPPSVLSSMVQVLTPGDEPQLTVYGTPAAEEDDGIEMVGGGMGQVWVTGMTEPSEQDRVVQVGGLVAPFMQEPVLLTVQAVGLTAPFWQVWAAGGVGWIYGAEHKAGL